MSFGFLGIQFGWGLQLANMSGIYTYLGAKSDDVPFLWLAGPMTGLLIQPIIGALSDKTWTRLGRRRPYFLVGAILASIALFIMPNSPALWAAATLLWILDASINVSMEPFRAFVGDKLPDEQRTFGFVMQSFFIGVGATFANALPYLFNYLGVDIDYEKRAAAAQAIGQSLRQVPPSVDYSFKIGAVVFLLAVLWTVFTSREYPPADMEGFERERRESGGLGGAVAKLLKEISEALREMPSTMKQLAVVQFFTWLGLFCMWIYFGLTTSYYIFGAKNEADPLFKSGQAWGGIAFAVYSIVCFFIAFALPKLAESLGRKSVHAISLVCGGLGLLSVFLIQDKNLLLLSMIGVGIAWASILSMPYAILSGAIPAARMGVYMGIFNFFIVIPEIIASLFFGKIIRAIFGEGSTVAPLYMVMTGGVCMIIAAILTILIVKDVTSYGAVHVGADEEEKITVQQSAQPVPSGGLIE